MTRFLVAYGSKNGSTAEIAEAIAAELRVQGCTADCRAAGDVRDLAGYDAVVLGSAVYMRRWRREARSFLKRFSRELPGLPFWIFSSGPVGAEADFASPWCRPPDVSARAEGLGAREHAVFGGRVPVEPHNFLERAMQRDTPDEFKDLRDWDAIRAWARTVAVTAGAGSPAAAA